jgi:hypothetical protein
MGALEAASTSSQAHLDGRAGLGLFFLALLVRLPTLPLHRMVEGDGVHYAGLARDILEGNLAGLANPYWSNLWPGVIAGTSWLTHLDVVAAGRLASLVAGCCLAPLTAALATRIFGRATGLVAGLCVVGHPWLVHFSTLVFTESFAACLFVGLLLAAERAATAGKAGIAAGVVGGLAVVTRPEAYVVVLAAVSYLMARGWPQGWRRACGQGATVAALVCVFVLARAALVHGYYGEWDFGVGVKGTANLFLGLAETDSERERILSEVVTPAGDVRLSKMMEGATVIGFAEAHPRLFLVHLARNAKLVLGCVMRVFPPIVPVPGRLAPWSGNWWPPLVAFSVIVCAVALYGLVRGSQDAGSRPGVALVALTLALYLGGLTPLNVHDRLFVASVPLFLIFLAHGLVTGLSQLAKNVAANRRLAIAAGLVGTQALWSLALLVTAPELDYSGERPVQREAGEWLKAHYPQTVHLMTPSPFVSYYFYDRQHAGNELGLPWADEPGLVALASQLEADLIVAPEWHLQAALHPAAAALTSPSCCPPELRHVVTLGVASPERVFIYEVSRKPSPGKGSSE